MFDRTVGQPVSRYSAIVSSEKMETAGVLELVESGTVKQRRAKAKQADEVLSITPTLASHATAIISCDFSTSLRAK